MRQVFISYHYNKYDGMEFPTKDVFDNVLVDCPGPISSNEEFLEFLNKSIRRTGTIVYFKIMDF